MIFSNRTVFSGGTPNSTAGLGGWELSSGTLQDGEFTATVVFDPSANTPGTYSLNGFRFWDTNNFVSQYPTQQDVLTVVNNSNIDSDGPSFGSLTISPTNIDITTGSVTVTVTLQASDTT